MWLRKTKLKLVGEVTTQKGSIASSPNRKNKASKEGVVEEGKGGVAM